jgi:predicted phage-related endonuclease
VTADISNMRAQVEILRWCKNKRAEIKELEDQAKAAVQSALDEDTVGTVDGDVAVTWKSHKRNALDQKLLQRLYPETAAECMSTTEVRRFEVCD